MLIVSFYGDLARCFCFCTFSYLTMRCLTLHVYSGYFNKMYPISMFDFEKPTALISLHVISYESQNLKVFLGTSQDDLGFFKADL